LSAFQNGRRGPQGNMKLFPVANEIVYKEIVKIILFLENHIKLRK